MDYSTLAAEPVIDLYKRFDVDPADDPAGTLLRLDSQMEQLGYPSAGSPRVQVALAWKVLKEPEYRALYDDNLRGQPTSWAVIEYLANFGALPPASWYTKQDQSYSQSNGGQRAEQFAKKQENPYSTNNTARSVREREARKAHSTGIPGQPSFEQMTAPTTGNNLARSNTQGRGVGYPGAGETTGARAPQSTRVVMGLSDYFIVNALGLGVLGLNSDAFAVIITLIVALVYVVGFEVWTGASLTKHILGYTVRNAFTGENLTVKESLLRNWWKLAGVIPGIGTTVGAVAGIIYAISISEERALVAKHDELVKAEVVRK